MAKLVYIAHPVSGDVHGNIKKITAICKELHLQGLVPCVPYLVSLQYLDDTITHERAMGIAANEAYFKRGVMDEVLVCGDRISPGMQGEIKLARTYNIPIRAHDDTIKEQLDEFVATLTQTPSLQH